MDIRYFFTKCKNLLYKKNNNNKTCRPRFTQHITTESLQVSQSTHAVNLRTLRALLRFKQIIDEHINELPYYNLHTSVIFHSCLNHKYC